MFVEYISRLLWKEKFKEFVNNDIPTLECTSNEDFEDKYLEFYNSFLDE